MSSKEFEADVKAATPPSPTQDPEKSTGQTDFIPEDRRETDFMTRNGLNLRSFQRRKLADTLVFCPPHAHIGA